MRKLLLIALMLISGCAVPITAVPVNGIERSAALPLTDLRPETEKQRALFSANVFSDAYGTFRMGDDLVTPPPTRLFQHRASEKFGVDRPEPLTITLHHLVVYRNMEAELKGAAMEGAVRMSTGGFVAGTETRAPSDSSTTLVDRHAFDALIGQEYKRALYTESENPGRGSVCIVYIDAELRGKRVFTRTLVPTKASERDAPLAGALESAIRSHLAQYE